MMTVGEFELYSQNFIFFTIYEWARWTRVVVNTRLEIRARNKHSSLPDPFKTFEENFPAKIRERLHGWYISLSIGSSISPASLVLDDCLIL
jgi:hypothetical protein